MEEIKKFKAQKRFSAQDLLRHGRLHLLAQKKARVVETGQANKRWSMSLE